MKGRKMQLRFAVGNAALKPLLSSNPAWAPLAAAFLVGALLAAPALSQEKAAADADDQRILGSWKSIRFEQDGKVDPTGAGGKIVFTPGHCYLHTLPGELSLDASQNPKHFNWDFGDGIYEIQGDTLRVCIPKGSGEPRPKAFKTTPGDRLQMIVMKRVMPLDPKTPDAEIDPELKKVIVDAVAALEKGDVETYLKTILPSGTLDRMKGAERERTLEHVSSQKEGFLNTFRTIQKIKPQLAAGGSIATFDLTDCHIEGGLPFQQIRFAKSLGRWHALNR